MYESLHNHTIISDGQQSHLQALASAEETGFGTVVFTDHDVFPSGAVLEELRGYRGPVVWDIGIELSCGLPAELGGVEAGNVHVLGYFCDPQSPALAAYLERLRASRYVRLERQVGHLQSLGFEITTQDCLEVAGAGAPGSHSVVATIYQKPGNVERLEQLRQEFMEAAQATPELKPAYDQMMERGSVQYPYALFMKSSSFKPMPQDTLGSDMVDMDAAVALIREAGGVAVLAHWYFHEKAFPREALERVLSENRLDGLETAVHNRQLGDAVYPEAIAYLSRLCVTAKCASTIGIDGHYPEDFQYFLDHGDPAATVGQYNRLRNLFPRAFDIRKAT